MLDKNKELPMTLINFQQLLVNPEHEDLSLLGRYKEYLIENSYKHHYGLSENIGRWIEVTLQAYKDKFE